MSAADYWRNREGAALLRLSRAKLRELDAGQEAYEGLRDFVQRLDAFFGSGAIQAVAINAEPMATRTRKRKPKLRIINGSKGE
jgi:hypothetical protein